MLAIKFRRIGRKHQPSFRVVVTEKRSKLQGKYVEDLGWMNPLRHEYKINQERALHWIKAGAQPTDTVHNLFVKSGIVAGPKRPKHKMKKVEDKAE